MVQTASMQALDGLQGHALLNDPIHNKGTAFTAAERSKYGLEGLLPQAVEGLERQVERVLGHLDAKPTDLERYIYLIGLSDRTETLFYRTVMSDPARFIPILYDPTVAEACLTFGHIYRRARRVHHARDEESHGRGAAQLAGAGHPLHLRLDRRPHPRSRRHRRETLVLPRRRTPGDSRRRLLAFAINSGAA
jgi:hypothetical protein